MMNKMTALREYLRNWIDKDRPELSDEWVGRIVRILPLVAILYFLITMFFVMSVKAQELTDKALVDKAVLAKTGDLLMRSGNKEVFKGDKGTLVAHLFTSPQWDKTGSPLIEATASGDTVFVGEKYYLIFSPDAATAKLKKKVTRGNAGTKVEYTVPDSMTPKLSWNLFSNATVLTDASKRLMFYGDKGEYLMEVPPPTAWDAKGKPVTLGVEYVKGTLTYALLVTGDTAYPVTVDPTSVVATNDGSITCSPNLTYTTIRDATAGAYVYTQYLRIGHGFDGDFYDVMRLFASFAIPNMSTLTAASLFLEGKLDGSTVDFGIYIHSSTYSNPLVKEDFDLFDGRQASGVYNGTILNNVWNSSSYDTTWNEIVLNAAGLAVVLAAKNTTLRLAAISKEDYDNSAPSDYEYLEFESSYTAGKEPYLSITYTLPTAGLTRSTPYDKAPSYLYKEGAAVPLWKP